MAKSNYLPILLLTRLETFREKMKSDGMVMCMRLICSGYLRKNSILYEHFLEEGMTMEHFCLTEVEPIDSNTDQVSILSSEPLINNMILTTKKLLILLSFI